MIKQAVILCAGLGTRFRPYTDNMPKVMIPILGKPMLEWHIIRFKECGVSEFFINLHYLPDVIRDYFGDGSKFGVKIFYNFEREILGTAGGLKKFGRFLDKNFFLIYGDIFSLVDYSKMEEVWNNKPNAIGMQRMQAVEFYGDADVAELNSKMMVISVHSKPHTRKYSNAYRMRGIFILNKRVLAYIPKDVYYEIGSQLLPDLVKNNEAFYSYECDDYSKGIDSIEKLKEAENFFKNSF